MNVAHIVKKLFACEFKLFAELHKSVSQQIVFRPFWFTNSLFNLGQLSFVMHALTFGEENVVL